MAFLSSQAALPLEQRLTTLEIGDILHKKFQVFKARQAAQETNATTPGSGPSCGPSGGGGDGGGGDDTKDSKQVDGTA